jgi:hypothetical protein
VTLYLWREGKLVQTRVENFEAGQEKIVAVSLEQP